MQLKPKSRALIFDVINWFYYDKKIMTFESVIKPSASILLESKKTSVLTNEALFGEKVIILDKHKDFFLTELKTDSYQRWINKHDLGFYQKQIIELLN